MKRDSEECVGDGVNKGETQCLGEMTSEIKFEKWRNVCRDKKVVKDQVKFIAD